MPLSLIFDVICWVSATIITLWIGYPFIAGIIGAVGAVYLWWGYTTWKMIDEFNNMIMSDDDYDL